MLRIPFGKHKGIDLDRIPRDYLRWVLRNCDNLDHRLRRAIEDQLGQPAPWIPPFTQPREAAQPALDNIIRAWHRQMTLKYHPDRGGSHEAMLAVNDGADLLRTLAKQIAGAA